MGRWVRLVVEYLIKGFEEKAFFYDANEANLAIDWIETHSFHVEGRLAPQSISKAVRVVR